MLELELFILKMTKMVCHDQQTNNFQHNSLGDSGKRIISLDKSFFFYKSFHGLAVIANCIISRERERMKKIGAANMLPPILKDHDLTGHRTVAHTGKKSCGLKSCTCAHLFVTLYLLLLLMLSSAV